jgi:hypothetical protein
VTIEAGIYVIAGLYVGACVALAGFSGGVRDSVPIGSETHAKANQAIRLAVCAAFAPVCMTGWIAGANREMWPIWVVMTISFLGVPAGPLLFWLVSNSGRGK